MTERYKVVRTEEEGVRFVGVVKEDTQGSVSAVSVRISPDPRTPVAISFHGTRPTIGTSEFDHCEFLGGRCHSDGRALGPWDKFPETDRGQIKFLTRALRSEERRKREHERLLV